MKLKLIIVWDLCDISENYWCNSEFCQTTTKNHFFSLCSPKKEIFLVCDEVCLKKEKAGREGKGSNICGVLIEFLVFYQMFSHISNSFWLFCTTHHKCESGPIFRWGDQNLGILSYLARGHCWQASELRVESRPTLLWSTGAFHSHHVSWSTSELAARHRHGSVTPSGSGWEDSLPQWPKRMSVGHGGALPHSLL